MRVYIAAISLLDLNISSKIIYGIFQNIVSNEFDSGVYYCSYSLSCFIYADIYLSTL